MTAYRCRTCGGIHYRLDPPELHQPSRLMLLLSLVGEIIGGLVVLLVLFIGIPMLLWLVAS